MELRWQGKFVSSVKEKVREHIPDHDLVIPPPAASADSGSASSADVPSVQDRPWNHPEWTQLDGLDFDHALGEPDEDGAYVMDKTGDLPTTSSADLPAEQVQPEGDPPLIFLAVDEVKKQLLTKRPRRTTLVAYDADGGVVEIIPWSGRKNAHLWEWFSGTARLTKRARKRKFLAANPVDYSTGWDLHDQKQHDELLRQLDQLKPKLVVIATPCTPWSRANTANPALKRLKQEQARVYLPLIVEV